MVVPSDDQWFHKFIRFLLLQNVFAASDTCADKKHKIYICGWYIWTYTGVCCLSLNSVVRKMVCDSDINSPASTNAPSLNKMTETENEQATSHFNTAQFLCTTAHFIRDKN